jgi:hypothetical protein
MNNNVNMHLTPSVNKIYNWTKKCSTLIFYATNNNTSPNKTWTIHITQHIYQHAKNKLYNAQKNKVHLS